MTIPIFLQRYTSPRARHVVRGTVLGFLVVCVVVCLAACHGLLSVTDPTLVQDGDIANPDGANARRLDVVYKFGTAAVTLAGNVALFTDELTIDVPATSTDERYYLDRRDSEGFEARYVTSQSNDPHLGGWDAVVTTSSIAIPEVRAYTPDELKGDFLAHLFAMRAYAILQMAEDICPGFPINDVANNLPVYGGPLTTDSATKLASVLLDSALADGRDSAQIINLARVTKGRALLDLGQYAQAMAVVAAVPTTFRFVPGYLGNAFVQSPFTWSPANRSAARIAVGDTEGTNGLSFVSANDPRVATVYRTTRRNNPGYLLYDQAKYTLDDTVVISSGIEARLIEAEAAINAGDPSWFETLNTLRATMITPAMPAILSMPVTKDAQIDLLYQERAFWLYLTGRRLGDMRRLIRNYSRNPETVFPTGPYPLRGGNYGSATAIPFILSVEHRYNPKLVSGCTTR